MLYFGPEDFGQFPPIYDTGISSGALTKCYISDWRSCAREWGNYAFPGARAGHEPPLQNAPMYRPASERDGAPPP